MNHQTAARYIAKERGIISGNDASARLKVIAKTKPGLLMRAAAGLADSERRRSEIKKLTRLAFRPDNPALTSF